MYRSRSRRQPGVATHAREAHWPSAQHRSTPREAVGAQSLSGRRFLIVTAPFGGFARILAKRLEARGASVQRMIFNAADAASWRRAGGLIYKPGPEQWAADLAGVAGGVTDLIVFGEGGPYNRAVLSQVEALAARVWVLENGYFRPDWITVERNGVNGSSGLPRFRGAYAAPALPPPPVQPVGRILPHHVANISLYHIAEALGSAAFPNFVVHYPHSPLKQCIGHVRRYLGLAFRPGGTHDAEQIAARGPFFIVCLQREGDMQLLRYSQYADNSAFLAATLDSFARHAPGDCRLVVKNHPLDPGVISLRRITRWLAIERGVADRVDFIDGGHLNELCRASRGMVVNNSSAALSALGFHTPVKVLGDAFFDFEGLTDQNSLDRFWSEPTPPDEALFNRFRAHVIAASQINGNYHEPRTQPLAAEGLADMFERADG